MGVHPFLHSYVLSHLYDPTPPAPEQRAARAACLSLAHKVPAGPLDGGFVLAFTATLAKTNQTPVKDLVEKWLRQSPTTASSTRELLKSLVLALQHTNEAEELRKLSHILSSACVVPSLASQTVDALKAGTIVDVLHRIYTNHSNPSTHLDTRFNLLFASNTLLLAAFPPSKLDPDHTLDDLLEALTPAMEDASTTDPKNTSWLADLEAQFEYIDQLEREVSQDCKADARFDYLGQILRSFRATTKLTDLMNSKTKVGPEAGPSTVQSHQSNARVRPPPHCSLIIAINA